MPKLVKRQSLSPSSRRQPREPVVDPLGGVRRLLARARAAGEALVPAELPEAESLHERILHVGPVQGEGSTRPNPGGDA